MKIKLIHNGVYYFLEKTIKIYEFLLNIYRFRHCFYNIGKPIGFVLTFKILIFNLFSLKKELYLKDLELHILPNFYVLTTLIEIYNLDLYSNLKDLEFVLDMEHILEKVLPI